MRDTYVDVTFEIPQRELDAVADPSAMVVEKMRAEADRLCTEAGGQLRTDRNPEVVIHPSAEHKLTGERYVLIATRWAAVVPESVAAHVR
jgi:hypothetical protein